MVLFLMVVIDKVSDVVPSLLGKGFQSSWLPMKKVKLIKKTLG